jgi:septal ring factor EnvC (AmiA/AmiB activator)
MKKNLHRTLIALVLIAIGISPYWFRHAALGAKVRETGIILVDNLNVQSEPGKHGFLQKRLKKGTRVKIIRRHQGWLQILHGGEVGFIRDDAQLVKIIREAVIRPKKEKGKQVTSPDKQRETLRQEVGDVQRKIETGKTKIQKYSQKEIDTINRLNELDFELHKSRKQVSALKAAIAELNRKIAATAQSSEDLKKQIRANEHYFSKRLVALYKLGWIGQINVLASADSIHEFFLRKEALERILSHDEVVRNNLEENRRRLKNMLWELTNQKSEKNAQAQMYNQHLRQVTADQSKRKKLLASIRTQKSLELASIESLKESAKNLNQKLTSLDKQQDSGVQLQKTSEKPITAFKGLLNMPVKGKIRFLFGPYKNKKFNVINFRSGIGIAAEKGEPVRAVYGGKIVYADWFKGYGNMIIIDHGTNYHTVYAHVEEIFKTTGDIVKTGEVIATVGDTGSMSGTKLQFEIRHHGKPLDPLNWLKRG